MRRGLLAVVACCVFASEIFAEPVTLLPAAAPHEHWLEYSLEQWPADSKVVLEGPVPSFVSVWRESTGPSEPLEFEFNRDATLVTIHLPEGTADNSPGGGTLQFLPAETTVTHPDGGVIFSALDAHVVGERAFLESHPGTHRIGRWNLTTDSVQWSPVTIEPGVYDISLSFSRATKTGTKVTISLGGHDFPVTLDQTGSWWTYRVKPVGVINIVEPRALPLEVTIDEIINGGSMNLKAIILTPHTEQSE